MKTILNGILFLILVSSCIKETSISSKAQLEADTTSISSYLRKNGVIAIKVEPGAWYVIDTLGVGIYPALSDSIKISYKALLLDNQTELESESDLHVLLSSVISGMQLTLPSFTVGSYGRLYIPSGLAFGTIAHNSIPSNANLIYEIKLINTIAPSTRLTSDVAAIDAYVNLIADSLIAAKITVLDDPSGIRYSINSIDSTGSGVMPRLQDSVIVTYTGNLLGNNSLLFANVPSETKLSLNSQIVAWKIILPLIKEGSTLTLYVPSGFGYGSATSQTNANVPATLTNPNSNLVYQIHLVKVIHH